MYRKLLFSLLFSVSSLAAAVSTSTYTVSKGDTAYSLAKRYGLSVQQLQSLNHLNGTALEVGQVLLVAAPTYTVSKGDTAYSIARKNGLSVDALLSFNGLTDPHLEVGQTLSLIPGGASAVALAAPNAPYSFASNAAPAAPLDAAPAVLSQEAAAPQLQPQVTPAAPMQVAPAPLNNMDWLTNAQSMLGIPYVWGANSRRGTDCSGFVMQVFGPLGLNLPRTSAAQAQVGQPVGRQQLQRGDLVFFDTEGRGKVTHVGISLGGNEFINANSYAGRVAIDDLGSRYWASRYVGARRVLGVLAMANASASH